MLVFVQENLSDGMNLLNMAKPTGMDGGSHIHRSGMANTSVDGAGMPLDDFSGAHEVEGGVIASNRMVPQFSRSLPTVGSQGIVSSEASMFSSAQSDSPTRFLWIGNLTPMATRPVLRTIFERFGSLEDLIAFPSRMYAFVTYQHTESAVKALQSIQGVVIKDITGEKGMIIKYRPERKAAVHSLDESNGRSYAGADMDVEPSPRIWLGNIAPTATAANLQSVLGRFGPLVDAAVFPARIGPLGYAFVKFERLKDAINAYNTLNNAVVPALSGSKQVKMRYKPVTEGVPARDTALDALQASIPSRHVWIGNVTQKPSEDVLMRIFSRFGSIESARVFSAKSYAFVNFYEISSAIDSLTMLDGVAVPVLTG
jgi:RNA recognition motif-containing protein